ncbi:MAG: quinate 5-dehydrogenase, partial [Coriobacteriia bacterium]
MKQVVSVSIGSSARDHEVEIDLLGERFRIRREGHDGDLDAAAARFAELDGKVDAFGMGGIDMYL